MSSKVLKRLLEEASRIVQDQDQPVSAAPEVMSAVWVKLLQGSPNSSRFTELGIDKITNLNQSNDIADLRKILITDVAFRNELQGIDSSKLQVYNNDEDATNRREPIEEDTPLLELIEAGKGGRKRTALIVVAPPKPVFYSNERVISMTRDQYLA
ncbi:hypothetical protein BDF19DRAFT_326597 [Syncephalis fuscata]|nr:hypothetical protein BDF19DRAFT_326597 [Syncephalis fuscata]